MSTLVLPREVKQDHRGLYINYGGCRLRPSREDTQFRLNQRVYINYPNRHGEAIDKARVSADVKAYEIWRRK